MRYLLHGSTLALAWFTALNVAASLAAAAAAPHVRRSTSLLFALRVFPAAASGAFVAVVFIPSYWLYEPRDINERVDVTLGLFAAIAAMVLVSACTRAFTAWWRAAARVRAWTRLSQPFPMAGVGIPAFRVDAAEPVMALAGIVRPRLLVTRGLLEALTPEELAASVAHEIGHHRAFDNLKRLAMRGAPDLLRFTPAARRLEREWAAAAEHAADAAASTATDRPARLALASALVKIARLMPAPTPITEPISTLVGGGEIASRVQRLIDEGPDRAASRLPRSTQWAVAAGALVALAVAYAPLLEIVHRATEVLVHRLP